MKKTILLLFVLFYSALSFSQPALLWQKNYGGSMRDEVGNFDNDYDGADHCIALTNDGYVFVGTSQSNDHDVTGAHGGKDIMVMRCDSSGAILWSKLIGGTDTDEGSSIIATSDGGVAVCGFSASVDGDFTGHIGSFNYDIVIIRMDSLGNILWIKNYGGTSEDRSYSFVETAEGGFMVAGTTSSTDSMVSVHNGLSDIWVFKTDFSGSLIWEYSYGGSSVDWANSIFLTADQGAIIGGYTHSDDSIITTYHGGSDYWAVRIDSNGTVLWNQCFGGLGNDWGTGITQTSDGGFAMVGLSLSSDSLVTDHQGVRDSYVVKFSDTGVLQWHKSVGGTNYEDGYDIFEDLDGNLIVGGTSMSSDGYYIGNFGWWDYSVVKLDMLTGSKIWSATYGGSSADYAISIIPDGNGSYLIAGNSKSSDFNVDSNYGDWDMWIAKLTDNYNVVSGQYYVDINSNSVYDAGDQPLINRLVSDTVNNYFAFTDTLGNYEFLIADTGTFSYSPVVQQYYTVTPPIHTSTFTLLNTADSGKDFIAAPIPGLVDLQIDLIALTRFRPGFAMSYLLSYENIATANDSGTIIMVLDTNLTFDSASVSPDLINGDTLIWYNIFMEPNQAANIVIYATIDPTTPIGTDIVTTASVQNGVGVTDEYIDDNSTIWTGLTTGSFDPNDKAVSIDKIYTNQFPNVPFLNYVIRFQNTGNDTAFTVVVRDTMSSMFDMSTFSMIESSHPAVVDFQPLTRTMTFTFSNILLADSNINETNSHGYIHYKVKPLSNLSDGDMIENTAGIYFDFNPPVITNTAVTQILLPTRINQISDFNFGLYPNPSSGKLTVTLSENYINKKAFVQIVNSLGEIVYSKSEALSKNKIDLNTSDLATGLYIVRVVIDDKTSSKQFIKQ
ncbi:MAG: T9SS type A sorting domain-containing protein [Bacteroidetes bacterium]|nr:T9SS type A sorting domain-containing protein [Bacteroidota bacterium]